MGTTFVLIAKKNVPLSPLKSAVGDRLRILSGPACRRPLGAPTASGRVCATRGGAGQSPANTIPPRDKTFCILTKTLEVLRLIEFKNLR